MYPSDLVKRARQTKLLICDVDGVLTDGMIYCAESSIPQLAFNVHDGFGLMLLRTTSIGVAIITASKSPIIQECMQFIGIQDIYAGNFDKKASFEDLQQRYALKPEQIAYVGDDLPDVPIMQQVGLAVAVANAQSAVHEIAHWTTVKDGGKGAVREVCNLLLDAHGIKEQAFRQFLKSK